ncbi:MAG: hypothetical protein DLM54_03150 [Acidimicrobiales bacterium]|nr:MAG: hypothetical protein DLM54_03150 [Acidimicrobiales bacterium]
MSSDPATTQVADTLGMYFGGIDASDFARAFAALTPASRASVPYPRFVSGVQTSQDTQVVIQSITTNADGSLDATVTFVSNQDPSHGPSPGETCTDWSLDYTLAPNSSGHPAYLIAADRPTSGSGHTPC